MSKTKLESVMVCCSHCRGSGSTELTGVYAETLALLSDQPSEINGANLARLAGIETTAMNNRLVHLESLGLVAGRQFGRQRLWTVAQPQKREGTENAESPRERTKREGREKRRRCEA